MKTQKYLVKVLTKMELNFFYVSPPISVIPMEYNKNKALQITEEGKKNLMMIQEALKNVL